MQRLTVEASAEIPIGSLPFGFLTLGELTLAATCPSTHLVTGGGYEIVGFGDLLPAANIPFPGDPRGVHVAFSRPLDPTVWQVFALNANVPNPAFPNCCRVLLKVFASCARNF